MKSFIVLFVGLFLIIGSFLYSPPTHGASSCLVFSVCTYEVYEDTCLAPINPRDCWNCSSPPTYGECCHFQYGMCYVNDPQNPPYTAIGEARWCDLYCNE